jgi:hypothetical protein
MPDKKAPANREALTEREMPAQEKPEQVGQQPTQSQANATAHPSQCVTPGRDPFSALR